MPRTEQPATRKREPRAYRVPLVERCPDGAIRHGPPDGAGRCPWCRELVATAVPAPARYPRSELSESWGYHYDPDEGTRGPEELRRRALAGLAYE